MHKVRIEFFHDVICSFCFPMSYRMRQLQNDFPHVEIVHRSFALVKRESDFVHMFGSREKAKNEIMAHWDSANYNDDLHRFNIEGMRKEDFLFPMSMKPLWAAKAAYYMGGEAAYWDLFDALQLSLFSKSKNIEQDEIIFENVEQAGIHLGKWKEYFESDQVKEAVEADFRLAEEYGLHGVPALVINGGNIVSGAVSLEQIKQAVEGASRESGAVEATEDACEVDR